MATRTSESTPSQSLRRSKRNSSGKVLGFEPTPREPIKRTKKASENRAPAAVNGSKDVENDAEDEAEPPKKKMGLESGGDGGGRGDENEMDVQESAKDLEKIEDQEMDIGQESFQGTLQPKTYKGALGDVNLFPRVVLHECYRPSHAVNETKRVIQSTKGPVVSTRSTMQIKSPATKRDEQNLRVTSMEEYKMTMEAKAGSSGIRSVNHHVGSMYPTSEKSYTTRQRLNNIPAQKVPVQCKKTRGVKETVANKKSAGHSFKGFMWFFWRLVLLVLLGLLSTSAILLAHKIIPVLQRTADAECPSKAVKSEKFADHLALLETQFPNQRSELWSRSKIRLLRHLQTAQPTEPVSLILTAGLRAERTLHCLAQGLAYSFSSALNASVLHIDGASKASQDSDEVKLDIDGQLRAAFEGDKPVAVVHRFEELPAGSTIIFYRYCDHENAAYKQVFLLFTVLLPQDEVSDLSLKEVEEIVHDHLKEKLVSSSDQTAFNEMDIDKFGGLWSRISYLILPVAAEKVVEQEGC